MRWNCPHCSVMLAISDEKLGAGWSFSRCYKCGGFALVRKQDIGLIKVDRAPQGENVLLPDATEQPMMSQSATDHLHRHISQGPEPRIFSPPPPPSTLKTLGHLPDPLPEVSSSRKKPWFYRTAIAVTGIISLSSGVFLYIHGQELWRKAQIKAVYDSKEQTPESVPLKNTSSLESNIQAESASIPAPPSAAIEVKTPPLVSNEALNSTPKEETPDTAVPAARLVDSVSSSSAAVTPAPQGLFVKPKFRDSPLRAGPGLGFPILGRANSHFEYLVSDWKNQWFKISIPGKEEKTAWIRNDLVHVSSKRPMANE